MGSILPSGVLMLPSGLRPLGNIKTPPGWIKPIIPRDGVEQSPKIREVRSDISKSGNPDLVEPALEPAHGPDERLGARADAVGDGGQAAVHEPDRLGVAAAAAAVVVVHLLKRERRSSQGCWWYFFCGQVP